MQVRFYFGLLAIGTLAQREYQSLGKVENDNPELSLAYRLNNGMEVVVVTDPTIFKRTSIALHVKTPLLQKTDKPGIGKLCAGLIRVQVPGAQEYGMVASAMLRMDVDLGQTAAGLANFSRALISPRFTKKAIKQVLAQHKEKVRSDEAEYALVRALRSEADPSHPYYRSLFPQNPKFKVSEARAYFRRVYRPDQMRLVVVSGNTTDQLMGIIPGLFNPIRKANSKPPGLLAAPLSNRNKGIFIQLQHTEMFSYVQFQTEHINEAHQLLYLINSPGSNDFPNIIKFDFNYTVRATLHRVSPQHALLNVMLKRNRDSDIDQYMIPRALFKYFHFLKDNIKRIRQSTVHPPGFIGSNDKDQAQTTADFSARSIFLNIRSAYQATGLYSKFNQKNFKLLLDSLTPQNSRVAMTSPHPIPEQIQARGPYKNRYGKAALDVNHFSQGLKMKYNFRILPAQEISFLTYIQNHITQEMEDANNEAMIF